VNIIWMCVGLPPRMGETFQYFLLKTSFYWQHSLIQSFLRSFIYLVCQLINSVIHLLIVLLQVAHCLRHASAMKNIFHSNIHSFIHLFIRSFIYSWMNSFSHSPTFSFCNYLSFIDQERINIILRLLYHYAVKVSGSVIIMWLFFLLKFKLCLNRSHQRRRPGWTCLYLNYWIWIPNKELPLVMTAN